jgi:nucleoside-diphosphate-sugar epimerase
MPPARDTRPSGDDRPLVVITGMAGDIGGALARALMTRYRVVGLDRKTEGAPAECIEIDLASDESTASALARLRERHGARIASLIHLAAYFDFSGEEHPLYAKVNVEGTCRLLRALQDFEVEQFVYSGTMLVHAPCPVGERIDETAPIAPKWAYPRSKAEAEKAIAEEHGRIPYVLLHLAGLYDDRTAVPTLAHQIARIYEREVTSHLYPGDVRAGQSTVYREDMIDAFLRTVDRRAALPPGVTILVGEPDPMSYDALQDTIGRLVHGEREWATIKVPKPMARLGAWTQLAAEPLIPDAIDRGEQPFVRPYMIDLADDHYALDISRARELLGWEPKHSLRATLPKIVAALKADPAGWYASNGIMPPSWLESAQEVADDADAVRRRHEADYRAEHARSLWAPFSNLAVATWLVTAPALLGYDSPTLAASDIVSGGAVMVLSVFALSWRFGILRWAVAAVGVWLLFAPLVFWTTSAAAYLNDTVCGTLVVAFAVLVRPVPGINPAAVVGPDVPPGWDYSPSTWFQRLPIVVLAFVGLHISRYLAAYQLGHVDGVWDPFFTGRADDPKNGTEEIITSWVAEAWPVSDAGLGAVTYLLEILTGVIGASNRWRTMPWLVIVFGIMIVPLGIVSITFIVIQPVLLGTWCTLCLVGAAAMLAQIPYSLDEIAATLQFLARRRRAGQRLVRVFVVGDTDEGPARRTDDSFARPPGAVLREMVTGGVSLPWNLALCLAIGVWLMFTRATLGSDGTAADADHVIGALVLTVTATALAEVVRPVRYLNALLGAALITTTAIFAPGLWAGLSGMVCGAALVALSLRRGPILNRYGGWNRLIV